MMLWRDPSEMFPDEAISEHGECAVHDCEMPAASPLTGFCAAHTDGWVTASREYASQVEEFWS